MITAGMACASDVINYEEFGAVGDGKTDDQAAIVAAHKAANERGLKVRAGDGKTYYIGPGAKSATVKTDVDFGTAVILIDDRNVSLDRRGTPVFNIIEEKKPVKIKTVSKLSKGQSSLGITLPGDCLLQVRDNSSRQYIRYGLNKNNGSPKNEVFLADVSSHG